MLNFTYHIPTIVYFGKGQVSALEPELRSRAKKVLIVTGTGSVKKNGVFDAVVNQVKRAGVSYVELSGIAPNPRLKSVYEGIALCKKEGVDFVLAVGGGSVIDAAKAVAAGVKYDGDVWDFFEKGVKPPAALPLGTVLTLAATGSEMNGNSVVTKEETKRKLHFGSPFVRPIFSILDPEYTYTVNKYHTAAGVVDIMVHVFEQYFSLTKGSAVQDRLAEALMKVCVKYGPVVCKNPRDYEARANIMWAGSLALNNLVGLGKLEDWATHAIEHELSAVYDISHGAGLAVISPSWMRNVLSKNTAGKFVEYGMNVWGLKKTKNDLDIADEAIRKTREFFSSLDMPDTLSEIKIDDKHFNSMAKNALKDWGQVGYFKKLSEKDIVEILRSSL